MLGTMDRGTAEEQQPQEAACLALFPEALSLGQRHRDGDSRAGRETPTHSAVGWAWDWDRQPWSSRIRTQDANCYNPQPRPAWFSPPDCPARGGDRAGTCGAGTGSGLGTCVEEWQQVTARLRVHVRHRVPVRTGDAQPHRGLPDGAAGLPEPRSSCAAATPALDPESGARAAHPGAFVRF